MFDKKRFKELLMAQFTGRESGQELSWKFIVRMCMFYDIAPAGGQTWLAVRNALQELINAGTVRRTDDIFVEHYVKVA